MSLSTMALGGLRSGQVRSFASGGATMHGRCGERLSGFAIGRPARAWGSCFWNLAIVAALVVVLRIYCDPGAESRSSGGSKPLAVIRSGDGPILSLSWSPDGRTLATAGIGTSIQTWDADSGRIA